VPTANISDTFNEFTRPFTPRKLFDQVFRDTPILQTIRKNTINVDAATWEPRLQIAKLSGGFYTRNDPIVGLEDAPAEIATHAVFEYGYYRTPMYLPAQDVIHNKGDKLIDLMASYVQNYLDGSREELSASLFAVTANSLGDLVTACSDAEWGAIDPLDDGQCATNWWSAHIMESLDGVSCWFPNFSKMLRTIGGTCGQGKRPTLIVVDEDTWDALALLIQTDNYLMALRSNSTSDIVKWGFNALWVDGVPIVSDRDMVGSDFVPEEQTRAAAAGHEALFLNWDHLKLGVEKSRAFVWDERGTFIPDEYDGYCKIWYAWGMIGGDERRTLGRIYNMDLTQDSGDRTLGDITIPGSITN
jgi:hypothetical protein